MKIDLWYESDIDLNQPQHIAALRNLINALMKSVGLSLFAAGVLSINDPFAQPLMHRDVVQLTEGIVAAES